MKNTKLSIIAIVLPALILMGVPLKVYATGGGTPPQVDVCVKNNISSATAIQKYGSYIVYHMQTNPVSGGLFQLFYTPPVERRGPSARFGPGQKKCEKFASGTAVIVTLDVSKGSDGAGIKYGFWKGGLTAPGTCTLSSIGSFKC